MSTALSVWFTARRTVELREAPVPEPGVDELLVRAEISAISAGTELLVYRGQVPPEVVPDLTTIDGRFAFPIKFGYACVGRVECAGTAGPLRAGQRVFALHPHQSLFVVPNRLVTALPDGVAAEDGIFFANLETAFTILLDAHPRMGESVAVFGQGVVGLLVTRLLRMAGAGQIIAIDPFDARRSVAVQLGADLALDPAEATPRRLRDLSVGRGLDIAIEASGSPDALQTALESVAFQGTVVAASWYGSKTATLQLGGRFHRERVRLISSQVSNLDPALAPRWDRERRSQTISALLSNLRLGQLISHRFPLDQAADAYRLLDLEPASALQVALTYETSQP